MLSRYAFKCHEASGICDMASQVAEIVYLFNCRSISDRFLVASQLLLAVISVPFPQIDTIEAMVIVWRVRGKIIRSVE